MLDEPLPTAEQPTSDSAIDRIRDDRDRFVAFAFTDADILIELDAAGAVLYSAGALAHIGRTEHQLADVAFIDLVDAESATSLRSLFENANDRERWHAIDIRVGTPSGDLVAFRASGYRLPEMDNHVFLSLALVVTDAPAHKVETEASKADVFADVSDVLPSDNFTAAASERLADPNTELSLIEFTGLDDLSRRASAEDMAQFVAETIDKLREKSVDGQSVTTFGGERVGVIHSRGTNIGEVGDTLAEQARAIDPDGHGITMDRTAIELGEPGLDEAEAVRALVYTVNRFAKSGIHAGLGSLREGYQAMLDDTLGRMDAFRDLVANNKFEIAYQPIVNLADRRLHHYEALVRFDGGDQSPYDLITFAEDLDMITSFDLNMCERIIEAVRDNEDLSVPVAVNLSANSVQNGKFMAALEHLLRTSRIKPRSILFEVTESYEISDLQAANEAIQSLRGRGFRVCLDDFGVGATNFDYLRVLQVDYVKIDGSYVESVLNDTQAKSFLKAIVHLCDDLGIQTIAEFVEDEETARFLRANRVRFGQGYLFGKPQVGDPSKLKPETVG